MEYNKKCKVRKIIKIKTISPDDEDGGEASQIELTSCKVLPEVQGGHVLKSPHPEQGSAQHCEGKGLWHI